MKQIELIGNASLLERRKTLFLCSKRTHIGRYERVFDWVESLTARDCVMCCDTTEMESEVLKALMFRGIPTILVTMNKFRDKNNLQIETALCEDRILILVLKRDEPKGKGATPRLRNQYLISIADRVVCGHVDPNGSVFPLLAGLNNVDCIKFEDSAMVAEDVRVHHRWTVGEDKILLRMFYEDKGIYAIRQCLSRSYFAIRERLRAMTFTEEVLKGREFEDYVLELFNVRNDDTFVLKEWQGDKITGNVCPENNRNPDFVLECKAGKRRHWFAVECKWRSRLIGNGIARDLFPADKIDIYTRFSEERRMPVFIIIGVGGEPSYPESLFVIPLPFVPAVLTKAKPLKSFLRTPHDAPFAVSEFC